MSDALSPASTAVASPHLSKESLPASDHTEESAAKEFKPDARFWAVYGSLCLTVFLSAMELTAVSTALPDMVADLNGTDFAWIGTAYSLAATALIPLVSGLSALFGRQKVVLIAIALFAIGSAVTGAAPNMEAAIAGRAIQGAGGGAILVLAEIVIVDLVPLAKRGAYYGILGAVWALASAIGPPIGGGLASAGQWRWLFYLNLPLSAFAATLVFFFMKLKKPAGTLREKLLKIDPMNLVFIPSATAATLGLQWSTSYGWSSYKCLVPLVIGLVGLVAWLFGEKLAPKPVVPFHVVNQRTTIVGYLQTLMHGMIMMMVVYYMPVYMQAAKSKSPVLSGVAIFPLSFTIAPAAAATGAVVTMTGKYKYATILGFSLMMIGLGLFTTLEADSSTGAWAGFQTIIGLGLGIGFAGPQFVCLAPIKPVDQPGAQTFFVFVRSFGQILGIAIGSTAFGTRLTDLLPQAFATMLPGTTADDAYAAIPVIKTLPEPLRTQVQVAFAKALQVDWWVALGFASAGLLLCVGIKQMALTMEQDDTYGLKDKKVKAPKDADVEATSPAAA